MAFHLSTSVMSSNMISSSLEGDLPVFVHDIDKKYICPHCGNVLRPPVLQTPCGHRICDQCTKEMLSDPSEKGVIQCPGSEEDCVELTLNTMHRDNATKRELLRLDVYCSNKSEGCTKIVKWGKLAQHLEECPYECILCKNEGCNRLIARKDLAMHEVECDYFLILCSNCNSMITQKDVKAGHVTQCATRPHPCQMQQLGALIAQLEQKLKVLQDTTQQHLGGFQETVARQERRIGTLEQGGSSSRPNEGVRRMESTVGMHDIRIAECELRFRLLETAAYDGILVWKIYNYARRKRDAIEGRPLSLFSQPFYSGYYGYKMCARVYLNGDGLGKGTHLSLFFVIMKGEYDALQQWPFRQKVTLSLLDQSGVRKHITDTFRPDPTSMSFRRPVGEMNVASGSPMFAALDKVENGGYLKDDALLICVKIDKTDMPDILP